MLEIFEDMRNWFKVKLTDKFENGAKDNIDPSILGLFDVFFFCQIIVILLIIIVIHVILNICVVGDVYG